MGILGIIQLSHNLQIEKLIEIERKMGKEPIKQCCQWEIYIPDTAEDSFTVKSVQKSPLVTAILFIFC